MRAFNARKTCKEHYLFKHKRRKLALTNRMGENGIFKVKKLTSDNWKIYGGFFISVRCFEQINQILLGTKHSLSIGQFIKIVEERNGVKIKDIGLTRKDFFKFDFEKIEDALEKYKAQKEWQNEPMHEL